MVNISSADDQYDYGEPLMRPSDVAAFLAISRSTLRKYTRQGKIAPPISLGANLLRYHREDILDYINDLPQREEEIKIEV